MHYLFLNSRQGSTLSKVGSGFDCIYTVLNKANKKNIFKSGIVCGYFSDMGSMMFYFILCDFKYVEVKEDLRNSLDFLLLRVSLKINVFANLDWKNGRLFLWSFYNSEIIP
jgi:hypothetical protein